MGNYGNKLKELSRYRGIEGDAERKNVSDATRHNSALNSRTSDDGLTGVGTLVWPTTKDVLDGLNNLEHTSCTTDEDNLLDVVRFRAGTAEGLLAKINAALNERVDKGLELGPEELEVDVLGTRNVHPNEGEG